MVEIIEAPFHLGKFDHQVGSGPMRIAASGIAAEVAVPRTGIRLADAAGVDEVNSALQQEVSRVRRHGGFPLVLAGNCNSCFGVLAALAEGGSPGIVWFDAHGDFNTAETSITGSLEGMALAIATQRYVPEERVVLAGSRDLDPLEKDRVLASRITFVPSAQLDDVRLPAGPVYVHVDVDVLKTDVSPGVTCQAPGGLDVVELEDALRCVFRRSDVAALTIANYMPENDAEARTLHIICGLIRRIVQLVRDRGLHIAAYSR